MELRNCHLVTSWPLKRCHKRVACCGEDGAQGVRSLHRTAPPGPHSLSRRSSNAHSVHAKCPYRCAIWGSFLPICTVPFLCSATPILATVSQLPAVLSAVTCCPGSEPGAEATRLAQVVDLQVMMGAQPRNGLTVPFSEVSPSLRVYDCSLCWSPTDKPWVWRSAHERVIREGVHGVSTSHAEP